MSLRAFLLLLLALFTACDGGLDAPKQGLGLQLCGNGALERGEDCDDGNARTEGCPYGETACTVCDAACREVPGVASLCGDGVLDPMHEGCDDGNAVTEGCAYGAACTVCDASCNLAQLPRRHCGDGVVDEADGEVCDEGAANDDRSATCRSDCRAPTCGDGITGVHEECDPPGAGGCRADCTLERCGDGRLDPDEACDEGAANADRPDACRTDCSLPACGDGIHDRAEACDAGPWPVAKAEARGAAGCALSVDGAIHCWGPFAALRQIPAALQDAPARDLAVGEGFACAIDQEQAIICWGNEPLLSPLASSPLLPPPGVFTSVAAGSLHACAIDYRDRLVCWGHLPGTQRPAGAAAEVVAGDGFACVRAPNGPMSCWGGDSLGELQSPGIWVVDLAAAPTHVCALRKSDRHPVCWGDDRALQVSDAPAEPMLQLSVGEGWSCGLTEAGSVRCWGERVDRVPAAPVPFVGLVQGERCAFDRDGAVHCAPGASLDLPTNSDGSGAVCRADCSVPRCGDGVIDAGEDCDDGNSIDDGNGCSASCARTGFCGDGVLQEAVEGCDDGNAVTEVCAYGERCTVCTAACVEGPGSTSFCGDGRIDPPEGCDDGDGTVAHLQLDLGANFACGIRGDGRVRCWGLLVGTIEEPPGAFTEVRVGRDFACALAADGAVQCFGTAAAGPFPSPAARFVSIDAGDDFVCGVEQGGALGCWDRAGRGPRPDGADWRFVAASGAKACGLRVDGTLHCWGGPLPEAPPPASLVQVAIGNAHLCGLDRNGQLHCWGGHWQGEEPPRLPPGFFSSVIASGDASCVLDGRGEATCFGATGLTAPAGRWASLAAAPAAVCGLRPDGRVECFAGGGFLPPANDDVRPDACRTDCQPATCGDGVRDDGESCDDGNLEHESCSYGERYCSVCDATCSWADGATVSFCGDGVVDAAGGEACDEGERLVTRVGRGDGFLCALRGAAFCWGDDTWGQSSPPANLTFRELAVGAHHACAIRWQTYEVDCWGRNESGQATPPAGQFVALAAGRDFTCGLDPRFGIHCWGNVPASAPAGTYGTIAAGDRHLCATDWRTGEVHCWGANDHGQATPPQGHVASLVSAGARHSCSVGAGGAITCWGDDSQGQSTVPAGTTGVPVAGRDHSCAAGPAGVVCWGSNVEGVLDAPPLLLDRLAAGIWGHDRTCGIERGSTAGHLACWGSTGITGAPAPAGNADVPDSCRPDCAAPACGDGTVDSGESCDDGNTSSGDGCSASCAVE